MRRVTGIRRYRVVLLAIRELPPAAAASSLLLCAGQAPKTMAAIMMNCFFSGNGLTHNVFSDDCGHSRAPAR
jgi:hypothetical protein